MQVAAAAAYRIRLFLQDSEGPAPAPEDNNAVKHDLEHTIWVYLRIIIKLHEYPPSQDELTAIRPFISHAFNSICKLLSDEMDWNILADKLKLQSIYYRVILEGIEQIQRAKRTSDLVTPTMVDVLIRSFIRFTRETDWEHVKSEDSDVIKSKDILVRLRSKVIPLPLSVRGRSKDEARPRRARSRLSV